MTYVKTEYTPLTRQCSAKPITAIAKHYKLPNGRTVKLFNTDMCGDPYGDDFYIEIEMPQSAQQAISAMRFFYVSHGGV